MLNPIIKFQDAVTGHNLDPNQTHAVYYTDGHFANRAAVAARCPHAKLYGITVWGETGPGIFACDSETGDLDVPQTVAWADQQIRLKVSLICVYANLSRWLNEGLLTQIDALERRYGVTIRKWVADYDNLAMIPSWADAKQFADPGPVDLNIARANFFGDEAPAPVPVDPYHYDWFDVGPFPSKRWGKLNERKVAEQYDGSLHAKHPAVYAVYRKAVLQPKLLFLAKRVAKEAGAGTDHTSWGEFHRGWRYQALIHRARGEKFGPIRAA